LLQRGIEKITRAIVPYAPDNTIQRQHIAAPYGIRRCVLLLFSILAILPCVGVSWTSDTWCRPKRDPVVLFALEPATIAAVAAVAIGVLSLSLPILYRLYLEGQDHGFTGLDGHGAHECPEGQGTQQQQGQE
jgi:hypothetical protein